MTLRLCMGASLAALVLVLPLQGQAPVTSGYVSGAGGVPIFYETVGNGQDTIVFIHGTPSTMYSLARDFSALGDGFTLVFFDQRGGGRSQLVRSADSLTWQLHVQDLEALRAHLRLERMNLFSVSWGSWIAALYAFEYPERVRRMVLLPARARSRPDTPSEPSPRLPPLDGLRQARADSLLAVWADATDPVAVCEEYWTLLRPAFFADTTRAIAMKGSFCDEPPEVLRHTWEVSAARLQSLGDFDLRGKLEQITAPTLVLKGTHTTMHHAWTAEWATSLPNSRLLWIEGAGGLPWLEKPDIVHHALRTFYRGSWPVGSQRLR